MKLITRDNPSRLGEAQKKLLTKPPLLERIGHGMLFGAAGAVFGLTLMASQQLASGQTDTQPVGSAVSTGWYSPAYGRGVPLRGSVDTQFIDSAVSGRIAINARMGESGVTALIDAASDGLTKSVEQLLKLGADVNATDSEGAPALNYAANTKIAKLLIEHGANVNGTGSTYSPLVAATAGGRTEIAKLLLDYGAHVNETDGRTSALMRAAEDGDIKSVKLLLKRGANVYAKDNGGKTAYDYALEKCQGEVAGMEKGKTEVAGILRKAMGK
jgi:hypothetical protein